MVIEIALRVKIVLVHEQGPCKLKPPVCMKLVTFVLREVNLTMFVHRLLQFLDF
jgi:hypothetical protein